MEKQVEIFDVNCKEDKKLIPHTSGIYGFVYNNEIIYIGQAYDIRTRIGEHLNPNAFDTILKKLIKEEGNTNRSKQLAFYNFIREYKEQGLGVVILRECVKEELNKYEEKYITQFKPKFNYKGVIVPYSWTSQDSWKKIKNETKQQRYIASSGKTAELGCSKF